MPVVLSLLLGLLVSTLIGNRFYHYETKAALLHFKITVTDKVAIIERQIRSNIEALYSVEAFFNNSDKVTHQEFREYTASLLSRHKNIQALEWAPRITHQQRLSNYLLKELGADDQFHITELNAEGAMVDAQDRDEYFPVVYLEPYYTNEKVLGFDLASQVDRREHLVHARDFGVPVATSSIKLVQQNNTNGVLIFIPIYKGRPTTREGRVEALLGFVVGVYRVEDLVREALGFGSADGVDLSIYDVTNGQRDKLVSTLNGLGAPSQYVDEYAHIQDFEPLFTRQWRVEALPSQQYLDARRTLLPIYAGGVSIGIFLLATYYFNHLLYVTKKLRHTERRLTLQATTDALTNISNRRAFDERLALDWARAVRNKTSIGLLMIDIDNFKTFNDKFGHIAGDQCLAQIATVLKQTIKRDIDFVARYGGEEFAVIVSEVDEVSYLAEQCRRMIEDDDRLTLEIGGNRVTVSIGYAVMSPNAQNYPVELVSRADEALYRAKSVGKNCCRGSPG